MLASFPFSDTIAIDIGNKSRFDAILPTGLKAEALVVQTMPEWALSMWGVRKLPNKSAMAIEPSREVTEFFCLLPDAFDENAP